MVSLPERISLKAGTQLFVEGETAAVAYLVLTGTVELFTGGGDTRAVCAVRGSGDLLGEAALLGEAPRRCSALARSDCDLLVVSRAQLGERIEAVDPLLRFCVSALLDRYGREGAAPSLEDGAPSFWAGQVAATRDILAFEHELRIGLERGEFEVHYQPIVDLTSRRLAGFEALARWHHPRRGLLQPSDFIPMAETSGVISDVTAFCMRRVAACFPALKAAAARNADVDPVFLSVNVSGLDLLQSAFAARTASILDDGGVDPEDVRLEVTESILMTDAERCARTLEQCRDQGFSIAIDDFGTGYSSLNYLNALPVSVLKMDRSFSLSLLEGAAGRKIVAAVLRLGRELGLSVIAEGIETEAQAATLEGMGCPLGQGYLFGRPLDHAGTLQLVEHWQAGLPSDRSAQRQGARRA